MEVNNEDIEFFNKVYSLYNRYGIRSVTMDDISRELGISKKTLYEKVDNKEELVEKVVDFGIKERTICFNRLVESEKNPIKQLFVINDEVTKMVETYNPALEYDMKKYYPSIYKKLIDAKHQQMYKMMYSNIEEGKRIGYYREEVNTELITKLYVSRINVLMNENHFTKSETLSPDFMEQLNIYHVRGLATSKGIEKLEEILNENNKRD